MLGQERQREGAVRGVEGEPAGRLGHLARHDVHGRAPDEAGDELVDGLVVERERRVDLLDLAVAQHHDAVAHRHGLHLVVRDVDHRGPEAGVELGDLRAHLHAELGVEVGERLVEEEHGRLAHDGAADGHALALPAGELLRLAVQHRLQPEDGGGLAHAPVDLGLRVLAHLEPEGEVLVDRHVRVERVALEHHRDVALLRREVVDDTVADGERPARDRLQPGDHPQQRALAAARRADEHEELPVLDGERGALDGLDAVVVDLANLLQLDAGHRRDG